MRYDPLATLGHNPDCLAVIYPSIPSFCVPDLIRNTPTPDGFSGELLDWIVVYFVTFGFRFVVCVFVLLFVVVGLGLDVGLLDCVAAIRLCVVE